jgi:hypothetical protein
METKFLVQVGRGPKGAYRTVGEFLDQDEASLRYVCTVISTGGKKRLIRVDGRPGRAEHLICRDSL